MVKRVTSRKKELEKNKQSKREEKQKRKEARQSEGKRSFEDMIAYVDAYGNICSEPQDLQSRVEVDASQIQVSVPKMEERAEVEPEAPLNGRVEYFDSEKGYGFIKDLSSADKYFFHISNAPASIHKNDIVTFRLERSSRGMNAVEVAIVPPEEK